MVAAARAFAWPAYSSMALLEAVCDTVLERWVGGAGRRTLCARALWSALRWCSSLWGQQWWAAAAVTLGTAVHAPCPPAGAPFTEGRAPAPASRPPARRISAGQLPATAGQRVLAAALECAGCYRPALREALQARLATSLLGHQAEPRRAQRLPSAPTNNAVVGPARLAAAGSRGLVAAMLPAAALLVLPALQQLPSQPFALLSALALISLVAVSDA